METWELMKITHEFWKDFYKNPESNAWEILSSIAPELWKRFINSADGDGKEFPQNLKENNPESETDFSTILRRTSQESWEEFPQIF